MPKANGRSSQTDYRKKRPSKIPSGNRRTRGSLFAGSGGAERPRLNTTLPLEALEQLDALALAHDLQRNEVITLALATIADPLRGLAEAGQHFSALAEAWEGFAAGPAPQDTTGKPSQQDPAGQDSPKPKPRPRKLGTLARARIRYLVALGSEAPRGWMSSLAQELGCTTSAISRAASEMRQAPEQLPGVSEPHEAPEAAYRPRPIALEGIWTR